MKRGRKIVGICIIICSVFLLFAWEKWGKEKLMYTEIPVMKHNVERGTVIEKKDVEYIHFKCTEPCIRKGKEDQFVGRESVQFIHKGAPLFKEYFSDSQLMADESRGKYLLSIPDSAVDNHWGNVKKGDSLLVYKGDERLMTVVVSAVYPEEKRIEIITDESGVAALSKAIYTGGRLIVARG